MAATDPGFGLGREAEALAEGLLARAGMKVLGRNVRVGHGELDLIARDGPTLVFVEVKARSRADFGRPAEFVDRGKRARLVAAAEAYLARSCPEDRPGPGPAPACRFDVVAVDFSGASVRLTHLRDAFRAGD